MIIKYLNTISLLVIFLSDIDIVTAQNHEWIPKKNKNGITIHTREDEESGNMAFKATAILETRVDILLSVFNNVEGYSKWMADTKVSKTLKRMSDTESYIYLEANVPWPLENRDMPLYQKILKTNDGVKISLIGKPDYIPQKKGITRIENAIGSWEFIPLPNNKVKVTYNFLADPGLNLPNWIINMFIVDGPYKTILNLEEIVKI